MSSLPAEQMTARSGRAIGLDTLPSREQIADRMFSDSCIELARIRDVLTPAFQRHQKALDAQAEHGRDVKYPGMGKLLAEAWREFIVQRTVEAERAKA
jgi:hypothetical protein